LELPGSFALHIQWGSDLRGQPDRDYISINIDLRMGVRQKETELYDDPKDQDRSARIETG
jgi:hypothetical protein